MNPKRLIEEWLPIKEIGVESRRERAASSALPPLYFMHVWWARRPLTASRAAILSSLLPAWEGNKELLCKHFADEEEYHQWFLRMVGILGDPVAAEQLLRRARELNVRIKNPNTYPRAFTISPEKEDIDRLRAILRDGYDGDSPAVLDPMAGGGTIPFESMRMGLTTLAGELNPVACTILECTLNYPLKYGHSFADEIQLWGDRLKIVSLERLADYYTARDERETVMSYIWARTVPCPSTGKPIPLSPNWWLRRKAGDSVAVHMLPCDSDWKECRFEIVRGRQSDLERKYAPSQGTVRRGNAVSPWTGDPVPSDYIKQAAQSGEMGTQLFALCVNYGRGRDFRLPTGKDTSAVARAEVALAENWNNWVAEGLIPTEPVPPGFNTSQPRPYGITEWHRFFSPRQLLATVTFLEAISELTPDMEAELGKERTHAVRTYLAMVLDKCVNFNSIFASWDASRDKIRSVFDRHDFAMKWSFAEMNMALKDMGAFPWALSQVVDSYKGLCGLLEHSRPLLQVPTKDIYRNLCRLPVGTQLACFISRIIP